MIKKEVISGIYCIKNLANHKKYIGQAQDIFYRFYDHLKMLNKGNHTSNYLQHAWDYYGDQYFKFYVIEKCPIEKLDEREIFLIKKLHAHVSEGGYNMSWGGVAPMRGCKHTEESKKKISQSGIERFKNPEIRKQYSKMSLGENNSRYGVILSEEFKKHQSDIQSKDKSWRFGKKNVNASSEYRGVRMSRDSCYPNNVYWKVEISRIYVGCCKTEIEAAEMYDKYVIKNGLPNILNFPNKDYNL